ncbi:hypothetical protein GQ55_2G338700 [Panicum hallii var. hallii]|uniref:Uncharacterized protein n=1 Tax=Panicum hallii var. hallii TaxID=1504633 RepID=A0A2T7EV89_9POAL|nr:hypothetical protein GQ55_2G338700 [Panicum hallii var. hallii]
MSCKPCKLSLAGSPAGEPRKQASAPQPPRRRRSSRLGRPGRQTGDTQQPARHAPAVRAGRGCPGKGRKRHQLRARRRTGPPGASAQPSSAACCLAARAGLGGAAREGGHGFRGRARTDRPLCLLTRHQSPPRPRPRRRADELSSAGPGQTPPV